MTDAGFFSQLALRIAGGLLHFVWQGAVLAFLAAACLALLERRTARTRYAVAVAFLMAMLAAPVLTVISSDSADAILSRTLLLLGQPTPARLNTEQWASWIAAIWLGGVTGAWIRLAVGWRLSLRMVRQGIVPSPEISALFEGVVQRTRSGAVRLLVSVRAVSPVVIGFFRPVVLLPVTVLTGLSPDELCAVVAHELAHVRRHDYLVNVLQRVVESLLFYHPAVWWLSSRVRAEREHAADAAAIEVCDDPAVLARALVRLEETRFDRVAAIAATGGNVADRVARLLNREPDRSGWQPIMVTVSFMGLWAVAGFWHSTALPSQPPRFVSTIPATSLAASAPIGTALASGLGTLAALAPAPPAKSAVRQSPQAVNTEQIRVTRLSGRVFDQNGQPAKAKLWVRAKPEVKTIPEINSYIEETDRQGRYQMNIPPGRYTISIEDHVPNRVYRNLIVEGPQRMITVPDDQDNITLDLNFITTASNVPLQIRAAGPDELRGRIEVDDGSPLPVGTLRQFQVVLRSANGSLTTQPFTNTQGIFFVPAVPGDYLVRLAPQMRLGYYVKSMTYGSTDLTKDPLTVMTGRGDTEIRIVLTKTRPADIPPGVKVSGRISGWQAQFRLVLDAVVLAADVVEVADVTPKSDGSFEIEGVPPGRYGLTLLRVQKPFFFDVGQTDVTNLVLNIHDLDPNTAFPVALTGTGKYISGVVETANGQTPKFELRFTASRPNPVAVSPHVVAVSGREFWIILPEGEYRANISGLPQGYSVQSIFGGPLDLTYPFLITYQGIADRFTGIAISSPAQMTIKLKSPAK